MNEYGDERFLLTVSMPATYECGGIKGRSAFMWDRRRSLMTRGGPGEVIVFQERLGLHAPFHRAGHEALEKAMRRKGYQAQQLYMWAKRVGDCLELEYVH